MALDKSKLKDGLKAWMDAPSDDKETAIDLLCDAYETYAMDATATSGGNYVSAMKANMKSTLMALPAVGTPASGALVFATAISLFWTGAVLTPSTVTTTFVPTILSATLLPIFSNLSPTATTSDKADLMSTAIHTATITVITTNAVPIIPVVGTLS